MVSVQGTVQLGASQLLVDGLEHSAMRWVLAVQATCLKTHAHFLLGCFQGATLNGVKTCYSPSCSHGNWKGQEPEHVPWAAPNTHTEQW